VVVAVRLTARGRTTGILVEQRLGQVWATRYGKVVEVRNYASFSEALAAAGPTD
jgi:ketosteroid isomerase-like protein